LVAAEGFFAGLDAKVTAFWTGSKSCRFFVAGTTADDERRLTVGQNDWPDWEVAGLTTADDDD